MLMTIHVSLVVHLASFEVAVALVVINLLLRLRVLLLLRSIHHDVAHVVLAHVGLYKCEMLVSYNCCFFVPCF